MIQQLKINLSKIFLSLGLCLMTFNPIQAEESKDDFWESNDGKGLKSQGFTPFPGTSWVNAGLLAYFNFASDGDDENTVGFKISASMKDFVEFFAIRVDGFVGVGGPAEGLIELDVNLTKGLVVGLGLSHTKRLELSPRFGLYVEDPKNPARRGGIFMLKDSGGGMELSWPINETWSTYGEFSKERGDRDIDYTRINLGLLYRF